MPAGGGRHVWRRRLLWIGGILLLILLLVLTPPLINANRYRTRIADSISASVGRPIHLDDASFHLLPVPGFTLRNFVVSEDPAFGAEPTVRADTVEATLRVSSLWHRPVEFSTVRFVNPSVNLVRNTEGRWNVYDVLLHASHVESAPTAQRHAGPAPRFPYIEATSGRVNVKMGATKLPFSLTDTDFALWLPSPSQWRVRLVGHPVRTDTNISDPGTVRLEGGLRRAATAGAVPVDFVASWHDAPLGEASRLVAAEDLGWRGSINVDATLRGTLGDARLATKVTLGGLRRAEFFPAHPLDLQITCGSAFQLTPASLAGVRCVMPDDATQPLMLQADRVNLDDVMATEATVQGEAIPVRWGLLWAALFSSRVPTDLHSAGRFAIDLRHGVLASQVTPVPVRQGRRGRKQAVMPVQVAASAIGWSGGLTFRLPVAANGEAGATTGEETVNVLAWRLQHTGPDGTAALALAPTEVRLGPNAQVNVAANVTRAGYTVSVNGTAPPAAMLYPSRYLPQLGDGLEKVLPFPPTSEVAGKVNFSCTRTWGAAQVCSGPETAVQPKSLGLTVPATVTPAQIPTLLAPRSLSPLERAPFATPRQ